MKKQKNNKQQPTSTVKKIVKTAAVLAAIGWVSDMYLANFYKETYPKGFFLLSATTAVSSMANNCKEYAQSAMDSITTKGGELATKLAASKPAEAIKSFVARHALVEKAQALTASITTTIKENPKTAAVVAGTATVVGIPALSIALDKMNDQAELRNHRRALKKYHKKNRTKKHAYKS